MKFRSAVLAAVLLCAGALPAAVYHSKRSSIYFREHAKCRKAYGEARREAKTHPKAEHPPLLEAARQAYDRCEANAKLLAKQE
jgi:hypothetical protein